METRNHHTIDVTGLPSEAVGIVESLVDILRKNISPSPLSCPSVFALFGKAKRLRKAEDIAQQLTHEHSGWNEE